GLGSLTRHLAAKAKRVIAVEIDKALVTLLRQNTREFRNVEIVEKDIFKLKIEDYFAGAYEVVANIPYYLTSNLIRYLLEANPTPKKFALTVQAEVAERACASPPEMSLLALSVQLYGAPRITLRIPAGAFFPVPKVDSALLVVDLYTQPALPRTSIDLFFRIAKAAFGQKRKILANSLAALPGWSKQSSVERLERAGIDPSRRPQTLSIAEWGKLLEMAD
ncbi:MAG: ribosomal RNA small subunit methyltransferase A, partial [Anaerolineales bacterium]